MDNCFKRIYPRAVENRVPFHDPSTKAVRHKFFRATAINFAALQLLFLALFCYLFGSLFQQVPRTHSITILWVDYDGGLVGDAVRDAYETLQSDTFPTLQEHSPADYPSSAELQRAVCKDGYWAAIFTSKGASDAIRLAIAGQNTSAPLYNASDILTFIWNEARYPTVVDAAIANNLNTLSQAARVAYAALNGTEALKTIPSENNKAAVAAFTNPWTLSSINLQPTTQGTRAVYNTIVMVLVLIQDFFFLATINGLYASFQIYSRARPAVIFTVRFLISGLFSMVGSLLLAAAIWAFKSGWNVSGSQYALTWLLLWLFGHVNFLTLDIFTIWIPPQVVSMALISWVILNVTSIIIPFTLSSPFYRWAYVLPAHLAYEVLTHIWSDGCNPHLDFALPGLFVYELSGLFWTALGVYRRCHLAKIAQEAASNAQRAMEMRLEATIALERDYNARKAAQPQAAASSDADAAQSESVVLQEIIHDEGATEQDQREAKQELAELQRIETQASRQANFGPRFRVIGSDN